MRIVSLLPSATEILFALGFDQEIVGVSHECDFPPQAGNKRVVIQSRIPKDAAPLEIDRLVREYVSRGESLYAVDAQALEDLAPDLIITQDLCHVCAASPDDLGAALMRFAERFKQMLREGTALLAAEVRPQSRPGQDREAVEEPGPIRRS